MGMRIRDSQSINKIPLGVSRTDSQPNPDVQYPDSRSKYKGHLNENSLVISHQSEKG